MKYTDVEEYKYYLMEIEKIERTFIENFRSYVYKTLEEKYENIVNVSYHAAIYNPETNFFTFTFILMFSENNGIYEIGVYTIPFDNLKNENYEDCLYYKYGADETYIKTIQA